MLYQTTKLGLLYKVLPLDAINITIIHIYYDFQYHVLCEASNQIQGNTEKIKCKLVTFPNLEGLGGKHLTFKIEFPMISVM